VTSFKAGSTAMFWQDTCENKLRSLANVYCVVTNSLKKSTDDCELNGDLHIHLSTSVALKNFLDELTMQTV
jgi:hypothetical protein